MNLYKLNTVLNITEHAQILKWISENKTPILLT